MPVQLDLVESVNDIKASLDSFVSGIAVHPAIGRNLISSTSFWVYDPAAEVFGPSKFVGFREMTFEKYAAALKGEGVGDKFDGHETRNQIQKVLGAGYKASDDLQARLRGWVQSQFPGPTNPLAGVNTSKWTFVSLPGKHDGEDWSDAEVEAIVADYMVMLGAELAGEPFSKTEHRTALLKLLTSRRKGAVEFKHSNISASFNSWACRISTATSPAVITSRR